MPAFPAILLMGGKGKASADTVSLASPIAPRKYNASWNERYFLTFNQNRGKFDYSELYQSYMYNIG